MHNKLGEFVRTSIIAFGASMMIISSVGAENRGDTFVTVTAKTGRDWVEQCDQPGNKSESAVRVGACMSFLKGAREIAQAQSDRFCTSSLNNTIPGALLDVSLHVARERPEMPLGEVVLLTLRTAAPLPCRPIM